MYGMNYAWHSFGADFGGIKEWSQTGVSQNTATIQTALQDMKTHGVDVVRWWMFQQIDGTCGLAVDSTGTPTGAAGGTAIADIQAALALAKQVGVHFNFTLFSFDDFIQSGTNSGLNVYSLEPVVIDDTKRALLMQFVALVAQTVESDPNADRVVSWDVINEPEWVIGNTNSGTAGGTDPYGDQAFEAPKSGYNGVTFAHMEQFIKDTVTTLHQHSSAPVTVGSAAVKWANAWSKVGLDFYTFHMYDWVNDWYPYTSPVASYGISGIPVVMGEFPVGGLSAVPAGTGKWTDGGAAAPFSTMLTTIFDPSVGYAGAMAWAVNDSNDTGCPACELWTATEPSVQAFASAHACVTAY